MAHACNLGGQGGRIVDVSLAMQQVSGQLSVLSKTMPHQREGEERGREGKGGKSTLTTKSMYTCISL